MDAPQPRLPSESSIWLTRKILPIVGITALAWGLLALLIVAAL